MNPGPNSFMQYLTLKNIFRALATLMLIFFFIPSFIVSCSGYGEEIKVGVSALKGVTGVSIEGEKYADGSPVLVLLLILPILIIVYTFVRQMIPIPTPAHIREMIDAGIIAFLTLIDLIIYFAFRSGTAAKAASLMCDFKVTAGFVFNVIFHIILILLTVPMYLQIAQVDSPFMEVINGFQARFLGGGGMRPVPHVPQQGMPQQQYGGQPQQFAQQPGQAPQQFAQQPGQAPQQFAQQPGQAPQQFAQQPQAPQQPQQFAQQPQPGQFDPMTGQPVQPQAPQQFAQAPQQPQQFAQQPQVPQQPQGPQNPQQPM